MSMPASSLLWPTPGCWTVNGWPCPCTAHQWHRSSKRCDPPQNSDGGFGHGSGALVLFLAGSVEVSIQGSVPHGLHAPPALLQQCLPARHQVLVPINISEIPVPPVWPSSARYLG